MLTHVSAGIMVRTVRVGLAGALFAATLAAAVPAASASSGSASFHITVTVPTACFVKSSTPLSVADSASITGAATEACNAGPYQVVASYRPLAADETATLQYGAQTVPLNASGQAIVHVSSMADVTQVAYQLQSGHLDSQLDVSLSIQPT